MPGRHKPVTPVVAFLAPLASNFEGLKDRYATLSWCVFTLKIKTKGTFTLLFLLEISVLHEGPLGHLDKNASIAYTKDL